MLKTGTAPCLHVILGNMVLSCSLRILRCYARFGKQGWNGTGLWKILTLSIKSSDRIQIVNLNATNLRWQYFYTAKVLNVISIWL